MRAKSSGVLSAAFLFLFLGACADAPEDPDERKIRAPETSSQVQQLTAACDGGTTTLTGTVLAPTDPTKGFGNPDPIPNALVYVPSAPLKPFSPGISCEACSDSISGTPVASTKSGPDGKFTLLDAPCGTDIPLVIQVGRWRRLITIPSVACCANTALSAAQTRLPRNQREGDIPLIAVTTGNADGFECALRKIGIDDSEFTAPTGTGRVRMYRDNGISMIGTTTLPAATILYNSPAELVKYDAVILNCVGAAVLKTALQQQNLVNYANAGGRILATHFSYVWLYNVPPWSGTAAWLPQQTNPVSPINAFVDTSTPKGVLFQQWLSASGASSISGQIQVLVARHDLNSVNPPAQRWLYADPTASPNTPLEFTFDTPIGAPPSSQCGRVLFSDVHVSTTSGAGAFPGACGAAAPLTPQEKSLEFLFFDLTSCLATNSLPKPNGDACGTDADCKSGFCVDRVCCDSACGRGLASDCQACSRAAGATSDGTCGPVAPGRLCRQPSGACDVPEVCDGMSLACPGDSVLPAGSVCRPASGACDTAEVCTGASSQCPENSFVSAGTVCRPAVGSCDVAESCTGFSAQCPADSFAAAGSTCRPAAGVCDAAEVCTGISAQCPADAFVVAGAICRPAAGACDAPEVCTGVSGQCPADAFAATGTVCRPAAGPCDAAEVCTGASLSCPADKLRSSSTICRPAAGPCDIADKCSGTSANCPVDKYQSNTTVCRSSAGPCDLAEFCSGTSAACPADQFKPLLVVCRPSVGICDLTDYCTGASPACPPDDLQAAGTTCRPAASSCDLAETCSGISAACPPDQFQPDGTVCTAGLCKAGLCI